MEKITELIRYGILGVITTGINLLIFAYLEGLSINYLIANIIAYIIAVVINFLLNKKFVFKNTLKNNVYIELLKFINVRLGALVLDSILFYILVDLININVYLSRVGLSFVIILGTYIINKFYVFKGVKVEK